MKKLLTFILIIVLSMVVLTACGSNTDKNNDESSKNDGSITLKVAYKDDGPSNDVAVKYYEELSKLLKEHKDLDITFDLVEVAQGDYSEKLSLLLNSGEIPDIIYFQGGDQQIVNQDLLEDLTPYIEKSDYINEILGEHNKERLKNYPYLLWIKNVDYKTPVVRTDFYEKVNGEELLKDPSIEAYKEFFKKIVEENGTDNAITVAGDINELNNIFDMAFGISESWMEEDGELVYKKVSEKEKNKLAFYHELFEEGLLDNSFLTKQWDTKEDAFYNGESAVILGTNGKVIDFYNSRVKEINGNEAELTVLPPAKGEEQGYGATDITKESRGLAISTISEHKEEAFAVLDFLASPEGQLLDRFGFEGVHYNLDGEEITLTDDFYADWYARYWEPVEYNIPYTVNEETPTLSEPGLKSAESAVAYYSEDNNFIIPEELSTKWDAMENLYNEFASDVITGKKSIDQFDDFVKEWNNAGGTELTELAKEKIN